MNPAATKWGRLCALVQLLLSMTALAAVTVGIPYVLAASAGVPWPAPVTSLGDLAARLAQPASDPLLTRLLALAGWGYWAAFMVSLIREATWATRQLGTLLGDATLLRTRLRTLPTHRAAAAFLVGTLLLALAVIWRPATAHAATTGPTSARPPAASAAAPVTPQLHTVRERLVEVSRTVTYTVAPGDTLWDIARAHLGDPLRWPVIYQLNCDRIQSDGHRLRDPDLLHPGWTLHLPTSNDTPTILPTQHVPAAPPTHGTFVPPQQQPGPTPQTSTPAPHRDREPTLAQHHDAHTLALSSGPHRQRVVEISVGTASVIGVTTAAGIAAAVGFARAHARRRHQPDLTAAAPPPLAHAVRAATTAHLATRHTPPQQSADQPQEATFPRRAAPAEPSAAGTVACATREGRELCADLLAMAGGIALTGPGADLAARALAIAALSAAERLRPGQPKVRLLTPAATAQRLLPHATRSMPAWTITSDCAEALALVERTLLHRARLAENGPDEASQDGPPMDLLICDLDMGCVQRLKAAAERAAPGQLAVVVLNADGWPTQAKLTAEGTVTTATGPAGQLLHGARMFTLAPDSARELLDVLHAAHGHTAPTVEAPPAPRGQAPVPVPPPNQPSRTARPENSPQNTREKPSVTKKQQPPPDPEEPQHPAAISRPVEVPQVPVTVNILGGFRIRARGKDDEFGHGMREETREFIALLAAHPKGIRSEEITEALRMATDPEQAGRELVNLRRAVRRSLRQATGAHQAAFVVRTGDRHLLDSNLIATDLAAFTTAVHQAATAPDEDARAAALQTAVATYGGPLCEGADYPWADELREAVHRKAVDALVLLADHTVKNHPDPDQALALLDQAAEWDPYNEAVYQRIIRLQHAAGRDDAAHRTYALLKRRLADLDTTPDPATTALLQQRQPATSC